MILKNTIYAFVLTFTFLSCSKPKDNPAPSTSTSVCYLTSLMADGTKFFDIFYDNSNRIDSLVSDTSTTIKFTYNSNNQITKSTYYYEGNIALEYTRHYNVNGLRDKDTLYVVDPSGPITPPYKYVADSVVLYTYNSSNQVTRTDGYNIYYNPGHGYTIYTYNTSGELIQERVYNNSNTLLKTVDYAYDTQKSNTGWMAYALLVHADQAHNILTQVTKTSGTTIVPSETFSTSYTYNSNGYPVASTTTSQDGTISNSIYTYTCK
jgi:hypothetical protein